MKKVTLIIISFFTALFSATSVVAYAQDSQTVYPDDTEFVKTLSFSGLYDYALNSKTYAFADGKSVKMFEDANLFKYDFNENVLSVDCIDNVFYCATESGKVYSLPYTNNQAPIEKTLTSKKTAVDIGDFNYRLTSSALKIANYTDDTITSLQGEYKNLKVFEGNAYVMLDNVVYKMAGAERQEVVLKYTDYTSTTTIAVGEAKTLFQSYSKPQLLKVKANVSITEVDLKSVSEEFFITGKTLKSKENTTALLIAYSGNAAIISIGSNAYILSKANVEEINENTTSTPEFEYGKITAVGCKIYSKPYIAESLAILNGTSGLIVKISGKVTNSAIDGTFFEIEITSDDKTIKGYIKEQFAIKTDYVKEDDKKPSEVNEEKNILDDDVTTILSVMGVVILITAVIGYIALKSSQDKTQPKKKDKKVKMDLGVELDEEGNR